MTDTLPVIRSSGVDRLISCPASRTLEAKLHEDLLDFSGEVEGDAMTWRGNWCHFWSARRLVVDHGAIAPDGLAAPVLPASWKPQPWDERLVDWYVANVMIGTPEDHAIFVEHRLTFPFGACTLSGQIDTYTINPDITEFTIDDLKSGPNEVDTADNNWQLACYACLLKLKYPTLQRGKLRIFQRASTTPISEVEIDDLDILVEYMKKRIATALGAWLLLETGYKQCRLCPCIEFCEALHAEIEAMKVLLTAEKIAELKVTRDLKQLAELAARGRAIAGPIERLLDTLKERLANGASVQLDDGTTVAIVEKPGRRSISSPEVAFHFVREKLGDEAAWKTLSMSLTELEDLLVESGMKRTSKIEESATSWVKSNLSHLILQPNLKSLKFS